MYTSCSEFLCLSVTFVGIHNFWKLEEITQIEQPQIFFQVIIIIFHIVYYYHTTEKSQYGAR